MGYFGAMVAYKCLVMLTSVAFLVACRLAYSLQSVDLSNNFGLTGFIPPQLALSQSLQRVRISNTSLSCSGVTQPYTITTNASCSDPQVCRTPKTFGDNSTERHVCSPEEQLPCFLKFSNYLVPRDEDSNMRCKVILRREEEVQACQGNSQTQLGEQASLIPQPSAFMHEQTWYVDPRYYQFQACECLVVSAPCRPTNTCTKIMCCCAFITKCASIILRQCVIHAPGGSRLAGVCW